MLYMEMKIYTRVIVLKFYVDFAKPGMYLASYNSFIWKVGIRVCLCVRPSGY